MNEREQRRIAVDDGLELAVYPGGSGEPVVFLHGVGIPNSYLPLTEHPAMVEEFRTIRYHRRGYGGSSRTRVPVPLAEQARDARAVIDALGLGSAHVVGHSYGGCVALQLANDAPEVVRSLALFEPVLFSVPSANQLAGSVAPLVNQYMTGSTRDVVDQFFVTIDGPEWRAEVAATVPDGPAQAERDAAALFEVDLPSIVGWSVEPTGFDRPVLYVIGSQSMTMFWEGRDLVGSWFPQLRTAVLPGANHLLQMRCPAAAATELVRFLREATESRDTEGASGLRDTTE